MPESITPVPVDISFCSEATITAEFNVVIDRDPDWPDVTLEDEEEPVALWTVARRRARSACC